MLDYYLLDWLAMIFSFTAVWMLGNKKRSGFVIFAISNLLWVGMGIVANSWAVILGNLAFLVTNARGYVRWGAEPETEAEVAS